MKAADVMEQVVSDLVAMMEAGAGDWAMPWRQMGPPAGPPTLDTGNRCSGGNALVLGMVAARHGFPSSRWATYKQWTSTGAQVRKGKRGTPPHLVAVEFDSTGSRRRAWARSDQR